MEHHATTYTSLTSAFGETEPLLLFAKAYHYFFAPRTVDMQALATTRVAEAVHAYTTNNDLPPWLMQALASKERTATHVEADVAHNLSESIDTVLDSNPSFVQALVDAPGIWGCGIPLLYTLIFVQVYGELPTNKPETPSYYADGVTDARWETILNTKNTAGDKTGYRYLVDALRQRGVPL